MNILGIETSCDETAAAVVKDGRYILSNVVSSQVDIHARYGGIVPEVASRQHMVSIIPVIKEAFKNASLSWQDIEAIAVTFGPGLAGSLLVGVNTAKAISAGRGLPLIGINHLHAHIYANWLGEKEPEFPLVCLVVSGGHTDLILMEGHGSFTLLGQTRDDAAGEAFDKAARILGLGYPGGPSIDKAAEGAGNSIELPRAWLKGSSDFSFSGLKTALLRLSQSGMISDINQAAAGFRAAVVDVLVTKTISAARKHHARQILLSGGVAANKLLRQEIVRLSHVPVLIPSPGLCTDNAAMIAACGHYQFRQGSISGLDLDVKPSLSIV
ncbi:MAG: tRNA (adenosine(37)-N6)-threonylcarbamoyltransferase complex transferase subunit TsaD [Dehalococcoidaceae bacterium]|nr:tRNA (adenosine(37)-N6)-threonylcarbamoyltransferase complex transferase subunit TsaD [Dehalococcoidaceae bacterium]